MSDNRLSENGNFVSEDDMTSTALTQAKEWHDALMTHEFRGRGDREKSVRGRLSEKTGISESYLFRLQYKTAEMKDVAGEVYRRLKLAYDAACTSNDAAADRYRDERMRIEGHGQETGKERLQASVGMAETDVGPSQET